MRGARSPGAVADPGVSDRAVPAGLPDARQVMDRAGGENFPVASRLLGRRLRSSLAAIYGFARLVDTVGDEASGDRLGHLEWLDGQIDRVYKGEVPQHPVMRRLAPVARDHRIPPEPLHRLVEANRRDQTVHSYASFDDLLEYCALSANPVGHMVLHVFDAATPDRVPLADAICSGLQVTEHLQDVREDLARGRVYLPADDLARFGCTEEDLRLSPSPERVRALVAFEVERARELLGKGTPLIGRLSGRAAVAVWGFVSGGLAALLGIEQAGYEVAAEPPRPSITARIAAALQAIRAR
jgi:squalene synthase HpnC